MVHQEIFPLKVYYADTDSGGLVYYATYMRWMEMSRSEYFTRMGVDLRKQQQEGKIYVVAKAQLTYLKPGQYADLINLVVNISDVSLASFKFEYQFLRPEPNGTTTTLVEATTQMVCVSTGDFRMQPIPPQSLALLRERSA